MSAQAFGHLPDGRVVHRISLNNKRVNVCLLTLGASLQNLTLDETALVVGSEKLSDYLGPMQYFGAIVGRVANRIAHATSTLNGQRLILDANETNGNCLHGGRDGASTQLWDLIESGSQHAVLGLTLADGHMGFPGKLDVQARYELHEMKLRLEITARTDAKTLCSFAPHAYWNLSGEQNIDDHELKIDAKNYLPMDARSIPTGEVAQVKNTELDFSKMRKISGAELDHNFCLSDVRQELRPILWLQSAESGVMLEVASTEAGVQVYDARHASRAGLAIEPQVWPDAINQKGFPNMILDPGETYRAITEFRLSKGAHT